MHAEDFLTPAEFAHLLNSARDSRERALLLLLGGCGLRVSEVACLRIEHIDTDDGYLYVVGGKGGKDRTVVLPAPVAEAVRDLGIDAGYLFRGRQAGHISTRQITNLLDRIATEAGVQEVREGKTRRRRRVTPHLLRHSHASWLLDLGVPVSDVQNQLGHASLSTTGLYLARRPNHRRETIGKSRFAEMLYSPSTSTSISTPPPSRG